MRPLSYPKPQLQKRRFIFVFALLSSISLFSTGCTENPFGDNNEISSGTRSVSGTVSLSDRASPEGTWVWLEGFKLGAHANAQGRFAVTLPASTQSGATGVFSLYFYLANYALNTADVVTRNGAFIYDQAEINKKGELTSTKSLKKFLSIRTALAPASVPSNFSDRIDVQVTLEALGDTVTVIIPETPGAGNLIGALLIRNLAQSEVFIHKTSPIGQFDAIITLQPGPVYTLAGSISLLSLPLPPGDYEVIPYILIRHQRLPEGLLDTFGTNLESLGANYLQIPMRREGGHLRIMP